MCRGSLRGAALLVSLLVALPLGAGCGGAQGKGESPEQSEKEAEPVTVVELAKASKGQVIEEIVSSSVVEALAKADLVPEATGVVSQINKDEGDPVVKGEILAVLDNAVLGTGAERARGEVDRLEVQVSEARELLSRGAISNRELEDLEHQLNTARLSAREATRTWGQTRIVAPFDGVVASRGVRLGELATGATVAFQVVDPARLQVVVSLPERDLGRVAVGQPVRLHSAYDSALSASGQVSRIAPVVDAGSGTFRVTLSIEQGALLKPGQFVSARLQVDKHEDVLVVPKVAILWEDGTPVVYKSGPAPKEDEPKAEEGEQEGVRFQLPSWLGGGGDAEESGEKDEREEGPKTVASRTRVELGLVDEQWAEVKKGLSEGDEVVVVGQSNLRDGARIRTATDAASPVKGGSAGDQG